MHILQDPPAKTDTREQTHKQGAGRKRLFGVIVQTLRPTVTRANTILKRKGGSKGSVSKTQEVEKSRRMDSGVREQDLDPVFILFLDGARRLGWKVCLSISCSCPRLHNYQVTNDNTWLLYKLPTHVHKYNCTYTYI